MNSWIRWWTTKSSGSLSKAVALTRFQNVILRCGIGSLHLWKSMRIHKVIKLVDSNRVHSSQWHIIHQKRKCPEAPFLFHMRPMVSHKESDHGTQGMFLPDLQLPGWKFTKGSSYCAWNVFLHLFSDCIYESHKLCLTGAHIHLKC